MEKNKCLMQLIDFSSQLCDDKDITTLNKFVLACLFK